MTAGLDTGLGFYREVLALRGYRQEVLTSNIANANTPGFKAKDLDFKAALGAALDASSPTSSLPNASSGNAHFLQVSSPRHFGSAQAASGTAADFVKYKLDNQVTLDGNSVDLDKEKVAAAGNAVDYTSVATFTTQTLRMLQTAISGAGSSQSGAG